MEPDNNKNMKYFTKRFIYKKGDPKAVNFEETPHTAISWVYKDEPEVLYINYYCPYCNSKDSTTEKFDPSVEIKFTCKKCKEVIGIPKLRGKRGKKSKITYLRNLLI